MKDLKHDLINNLNVKSDDEFKVDSSLTSKVSQFISSDVLKTFIQLKNTKILNSLAASYDPHNISDAVENLNPEELLFFFKTVNSDESAEIFTLLSQEKKEQVVSAFTSDELQNIVSEMQIDNLVDFVDELPSNLVTKVLLATTRSDRKRISTYLNYKEGTAGSLMTCEYVEIEEDKTIKECLAKIRKIGKEKETIWKIFVVNKTRVLIGTCNLDILLENDEDKLVSDVMNPEVISVFTSTDEEVVVREFRKYDISILPVTNSQGRILGIITFDDIIDVANLENTEDIKLQAGVINSNKPYLKTSSLELYKSYAVWIVLMVLLDTFISIALSYMQEPLLVIPVLITILPSIMGTSGNSADQTSTVSIREISLYDLKGKKYLSFLFKEFKAAILTAIMLSTICFGWTYLELKAGMIGDYKDVTNELEIIKIVSAVSITFFFTIIIGKMIGATIPKFAKKIHVDPAVITSPIVSTLIDIISIVIFVVVCHFVLKIPLFN